MKLNAVHWLWMSAAALILLSLGGYMVGKDMALRDNARDAAPSGMGGKRTLQR